MRGADGKTELKHVVTTHLIVDLDTRKIVKKYFSARITDAGFFCAAVVCRHEDYLSLTLAKRTIAWVDTTRNANFIRCSKVIHCTACITTDLHSNTAIGRHTACNFACVVLTARRQVCLIGVIPAWIKNLEATYFLVRRS